MQAEYVAVPLVSEQERIAAILDEPNGRGRSLKEPLRKRQNFERIRA